MLKVSTLFILAELFIGGGGGTPPAASPPPSCDLINAHRVAHKVSVLHYSASLFYVAEVHRFDIDVTWRHRRATCTRGKNNSLHHDSEPPASYGCMFNKPAELTPSYPYMGTEVATYGCANDACTANAWEPPITPKRWDKAGPSAMIFPDRPTAQQRAKRAVEPFRRGT